MSGLGTDAMAVACILGGAGTAVAGTLALVERDGAVAVAEPCFVEATKVAPTVVLSLDGDRKPAPRSVVVAPGFRTHAHGECAHVVAAPSLELRLDDMRLRMERSRAEMERARAEMERVERIRLERARVELERAREAAAADVEAELRRVRERLERIRDDGGL